MTVYLLQEEYQKQAFEAMMQKQDSRHSQLTADIAAVQEQLSRLSIVEMNNKVAASMERRVSSCLQTMSASPLCDLARNVDGNIVEMDGGAAGGDDEATAGTDRAERAETEAAHADNGELSPRFIILPAMVPHARL